MTETAKKYLSDIQTAITLIEEFTLEILHFNDYVADRKTQSAVERQLAIIGEAINRLKQTSPDVILMHDVQIISFRNRLIHAYDAIDNSIVWAVLKNHLPLLKVEVNAFLEK